MIKRLEGLMLQRRLFSGPTFWIHCGDDGFEKTVNQVAKLEQAIGIQFLGLPGK